MCVVTHGEEPLFAKELVDKLRGETIQAHQYLGIKKTFFLEYPSVMLENVERYKLNGSIMDVMNEVQPDEVYIPHMGDMQKDHQIVNEAVMVAVRPKYEHKVSAVYAYETLSETEWNIPNTVNIEVKDFVIINLSCTVGHDVVLESFVTVYPGVNISGCTIINKGVELGTGSKIIQGIEIAENTIVGAGAVVVRNLPPNCTAMGIPAKPTRIFGGGYKKLLITGASAHGEVIEELAKRTGCYEEIYYLDDNSGQQEKNIRVIGGSEYAIEHKDEYDVIVAIGNAKARKQIQERYEQNGVHLVSLIHPNAILPLEDMNVGKGSVIMAGAVLQSGVELGNGVIVNTSCSIDHNCKIGNYSHIAVGSHLAGNVIVDGETWIGAGTVISNNINVCKNVMLGAGAAVIRDITEAGTYAGVPAKKIR